MSAAATVPAGFAPIEHSAAFGALVGPFYDKEEPDGFVRAFRVADKHANKLGVAHGGMLATFADIVLAKAGIAAVAQPIATVRLVTDFVGPARLGDWIEGRARVTRRTRTLLYVQGELTAGRHPVLVAHGVFRLLGRGRAG